jgi:putative tryptophan/tyrosine transport system substrate-binding protein
MRRREFIAGLGGTVAWPLVARAQQGAMPLIGCLFVVDALGRDVPWGAGSPSIAAFHRGIGEQGYVEGRNVEILYRYGEYQNDRWAELTADLVRRRVAVIFVNFTPAALAAKKTTATIPIVFALGSDPVQAGLVASLNRPGGNVTGTAYLLVELAAKRLELLHEIAPAAKSIGYLYRPTAPSIEEPSIEALETAARTLGLRLVTANASPASGIERAFAKLVGEGIGALLISATFFYQSNQVVALAAHYALPAIYAYRAIVEVGGLISYGGDADGSHRLAGTYAGRILKGENPADLPVQQSAKVELIINMKTAKSLGLTFPLNVLALADEVIEETPRSEMGQLRPSASVEPHASFTPPTDIRHDNSSRQIRADAADVRSVSDFWKWSRDSWWRRAPMPNCLTTHGARSTKNRSQNWTPGADEAGVARMFREL